MEKSSIKYVYLRERLSSLCIVRRTFFIAAFRFFYSVLRKMVKGMGRTRSVSVRFVSFLAIEG